MRIPDETRDQLAVKFTVLFLHPDERQRRLLRAAEARVLGHGAVRAVALAAAVSETTVRKGVFELEAGEAPLGRVRRPGRGRKRVADLDPGLRPALLALVEPDVRGDDGDRYGVHGIGRTFAGVLGFVRRPESSGAVFGIAIRGAPGVVGQSRIDFMPDLPVGDFTSHGGQGTGVLGESGSGTGVSGSSNSSYGGLFSSGGRGRRSGSTPPG